MLVGPHLAQKFWPQPHLHLSWTPESPIDHPDAKKWSKLNILGSFLEVQYWSVSFIVGCTSDSNLRRSLSDPYVVKTSTKIRHKVSDDDLTLLSDV